MSTEWLSPDDRPQPTVSSDTAHAIYQALCRKLGVSETEAPQAEQRATLTATNREGSPVSLDLIRLAASTSLRGEVASLQVAGFSGRRYDVFEPTTDNTDWRMEEYTPTDYGGAANRKILDDPDLRSSQIDSGSPEAQEQPGLLLPLGAIGEVRRKIRESMARDLNAASTMGLLTVHQATGETLLEMVETARPPGPESVPGA